VLQEQLTSAPAVTSDSVVSAAHAPRTGPGAWPTLLWSLAVGLIVFSTVAMTQSRVLMADSYLQLYAGRLISTRGLPHTDSLTSAGSGLPWVDQQWLAHWIGFTAWRVGGYAAVGAMSAIAIALAFSILARCLLESGASPVRAMIWTVVAFFVCETNTLIRAQSLAYPLFMTILALLLNDRRRRRPSAWMLAVPLVTAVYANIHGSVLIAVAMILIACGLRIVSSLRWGRPGAATFYAAIAGLSAAAVLATPYSPGELLSYYRSVLGNPVIAQAVTEWWPATFGGVSTEFVISLGLLIGIVGFALGRGVKPDPLLTSLAVAFGFAGTTAVRYQVWFAFPMALLIADCLRRAIVAEAPTRSSASRLPTLLGLTALMMLGLSASLAFTGQATVRTQVWMAFAGLIAGCDAIDRSAQRRWLPRWLSFGFPAAVTAVAIASAISLSLVTNAQFQRFTPLASVHAAAAYAHNHPHASILADDVSAPALLWLHPQLDGRVAFDARLEIFPTQRLRGYTDFVSATIDGWDRITSHYSVIVVSRSLNPTLAAKLAGRPGWRKLQADQDGMTLIKTRSR
jgi:hypothetical protein